MIRLIVDVHGIVQGVGFRPFVLRTARELAITGSVINQGGGVHIVCEGSEENCHALINRLRSSPPPGAAIFSIETFQENIRGEVDFHILSSLPEGSEVAVSPDLGICDDCASELLDPADRRYRYPFLNCTACGPRFTIVSAVPYDRVNTTMDAFLMCPDCAREYSNPENRRFHAQPTACPVCGPQLRWLENGKELDGDPIARFTDAICAGKIVAVKGLGGYHLACDAGNEAAVRRLRGNKHRYAKPLAVMVRDMETVDALCLTNTDERAELLSPRKPIVLLQKRGDCVLAPSVAPGNTRLGVMLPYTPLHMLLTQQVPPLVMTSANVSDLPMPYRDEDEARILPLCDALLTHNRPILRRMDDSVCQFAGGTRRLLRRARGFAPEPIALSGADLQILAFGAQLKNTFCLAKDNRAYLSGHIGDLDDWETSEFYEQEIASFLRLFGGKPEVFVHDGHPDYVSTRVARAWAARFPGTKMVCVKHHHAHLASVLAEHNLPRAQGFIWDGSGYGDDDTIWGGEQLLGTAAYAERVAHLRPLKLLGGDTAVHEPWRLGLYALSEACGADVALSFFKNQPEAEMLLSIAGSPALAPSSCGMGRLFDAVATIAGLCPAARYEGEAAIALEQAFDENAAGCYALEISGGEWDWRPLIRKVAGDVRGGESVGAISARFHRALVALTIKAALPGEIIALSGGVFQNTHLLEMCTAALRAEGHKVFSNERVPAGDGGISYGQAAVAAARMKGDGEIVSCNCRNNCIN